jgi:hypothetical protein
MVYIFSFSTIAAIIIMSTSLIPDGYRITTMTAILPTAVQAACHILCAYLRFKHSLRLLRVLIGRR